MGCSLKDFSGPLKRSVLPSNHECFKLKATGTFFVLLFLFIFVFCLFLFLFSFCLFVVCLFLTEKEGPYLSSSTSIIRFGGFTSKIKGVGDYHPLW